MGFFIIFPSGAAFIGFIYLRMFYKIKAVFSLITGLLWISYSIYEYLMYSRILCTGECNIRIDLFIIYPLFIVASLLATDFYYYIKRKLSNAGEMTYNMWLWHSVNHIRLIFHSSVPRFSE